MTAELLLVLFVGLICGVAIGQFSVWRHLHVPLDGKPEEWTAYLRECVEDRKLEQRWFD